ncbi:MAG TPA: ATP-binding protein [Gemmatimonadaceae bacterium]
MEDNPFRVHGVVTDEFFTDRASELGRILRTFSEPSSKLLVYGPRRMGKTSALMQAIARHEQQGGIAFLADVSTATTLVDIANRILEAAGRALGRRWRDSIGDFVSRIGVALTLTPDPGTGLILPSLDLSLRSASLEDQRRSLAQTLDAVDAMAAHRQVGLGVVLDEFQEIGRFGGEAAEWHLRGIIQHHQHVSYVLAGSQAHIIERMLDTGRAFYGLADHLRFGPIDTDHMSRWIDDRLAGAGVRANAIGGLIVSAAGPRTRDIVLVARQCHDNGMAAGEVVDGDVMPAIDDIVAAQGALLESLWTGLTPLQQNVLRAVAGDSDGLTTASSIRRYGLGSTGSTANAARALVGAGHLVKSGSRSGYGYDSPFLRRWVELTTLADVGQRVPQPTTSRPPEPGAHGATTPGRTHDG